MAFANDTFDNLTAWTDNDWGAGVSDINSGRLRQTASSGGAWVGQSGSMAGDVDFSIDWEITTNPGTGAGLDWETYLSIANGSCSVSILVLYVDGGLQYRAKTSISGVRATAACAVTSGKIRITRTIEGGTPYTRFYYKETGSWVLLLEDTGYGFLDANPILYANIITTPGTDGTVVVHYDNWLTGPPTSNTFDCPTAAGVDLSLFSTQMYDAMLGSPTAAAIPYFIATPQRHEFSVPTAAAVPDFHAYSDPIASLAVPTAAVIPMFSAKTGRVASLAIPTAAAIPAMTAKVGRVASFSVPTASAIPSFTATVHGFAVMTIPTAAAIPAFESYGTAVTIAANLLTKGIAEYTNYTFDSFFSYQGQYYGLAGGVIYLLSGTTDAGTAISSYIAGGRGVFGYDQLKTVTDVFLLSNVNGGADLTLYADDSVAGQTYTLTGDGTVASRRFKCALGVRGHEWRWKLANKSGSTFDVRRLELLFDMKVRR